MKLLFKTGNNKFKHIPATGVAYGEILIKVVNSFIKSGSEIFGLNDDRKSLGEAISMKI